MRQLSRLSRLSKLSGAEIALIRHLVAEDEAPRETASIDWELVLNCAQSHRLGALVREGLGRSHVQAPDSVTVRLEKAFHVEMARAVVRLHHLEEVAGAASRSGLPVCLLKGAAFATTLYPNPAARPMADLDVLVRLRDFASWTSEIESLGFVHHNTSDHASCFRNEHTGVFLELHQALTSCAPYLGVDMNLLFERSRRVPEFEAVRTLSLEDHLLHLCLHASFQHGFRQAAINAWDARLVVANEEFDARAFLQQARHPRLARWVFGGLSLSRTVFPSSRLDALADALSDLTPRKLQKKLAHVQASEALAPGPDASSHPPVRRLLWAGDASSSLALLFEILGQRRPGSRNTPFPTMARAWQLLWNHYLRLFPLALMKHMMTFVRPTPASLGEVRDV